MVKRYANNLATPFHIIGISAIILAGMLSAFLAHEPTRHAMWAVAYLILVVGVTQVVIGTAESHYSVFKRPAYAISILLLYNFGNIAVISGTIAGIAIVIITGSLMVMTAMLGCLLSFGRKPRLALEWAYVLVITIVFLSAPVGVLLALK